MKKLRLKHILLLGLLLLNTNNLFAQWLQITTASTRFIWHIAFADENTVYAVGDSLLMKSDDGGHYWIDLLPNIASTGSDGKLFNLNFINKDTGFVFTNSSSKSVLKTLDGGLTWTDVSASTLNEGPLDLQFVTPSVGYATCGYSMDSSIAKTIDGGQTWNKLKTPSQCFAPMAVHFLDERVGFYGENEIFKTVDGGLNWILTSTPGGWKANNRISDYKFLDNRTGFAVTDSRNLYKTTDAGNNWTLIPLPVTGLAGCCRGLDFDQQQSGYLTGLNKPQIFISNDYGGTWSVDATYPANAFATCIATSSNHSIIIGTSSGEVVLKQNPPLSVQTTMNLEDVTVYPNPSNGRITITGQSAINTIEIINSMGQAVSKTAKNQTANSYEIDLSGFARGLYFVKVSNDKYSIQRKVLLN